MVMARDGSPLPCAIGVTVADSGPMSAGRSTVVLDVNGLIVSIDENHAQALVLALQAAIAEVQARAVSL